MRLTLALTCLSLSAFALAEPARAQQAGGAGVQQPNPAAVPGGPGTQNPRTINPAQPGTAANPQPGVPVMEAVPEGWIRIATDTNNDGQFDRIEMIHLYDLEQARQVSARRSRGGNASRAGDQDQTINVEGTIRSLRTVQIQGLPKDQAEHQLARILTEGGENIRADLGPQSALSGLNLAEGQTISIKGEIGTIDDRPVLMADSVTSGEKTARVKLPEGRDHRRFHVQVLSTRNVKFKRQEGEHMIARVRLLNGQQVQALLGPVDKLDRLKIEEGDTLDLLAHPGRLNSEPVLVAEIVRHEDQVVSMEGEEEQTGKQFQTPGQPDSGSRKSPSSNGEKR